MTDTAIKKKILLIDDDASLLLTLSDFLKFEGYDVMTADSGEQGLRKLARMRPDLIILDMSMPGMGGVGFLKEISSADGKPTYPVLVLTARANMAEFFANVAVDGFIAKPCDPNDLLMEVGRIIFLRSDMDKGDEKAVQHKVLLGEDDPLTRDKLADALRGGGYAVETVGRGPDVLEKAIVHKPDVIVLKRVLDGMNGDAVAGMLKEMPNTRNIAVVLYDETDTLGADTRLPENKGNVRKFIRSANPVTLIAAVDEVLRG